MDIVKLDQSNVMSGEDSPLGADALFFEQTRWIGRKDVKPKFVIDCTDTAVVVVAHTSRGDGMSWSTAISVAAAQIDKIRQGGISSRDDRNEGKS
jgi:hypothetical protein